MKLLIADDEELTREGLISSIDWHALGIREIFQADDGIHALNIAKLHRPDIILCDIRMPRMNGIEMIEKLEQFLPDSSVIFMSGYSDKEYLKAAIKLKAINYVEKPLNLKEICDAVSDARQHRLQQIRNRRSAYLYSVETEQRFGTLLTRPWHENDSELLKLCRDLSLSVSPRTACTTFIIKLKDSMSLKTDTIHTLVLELKGYLSHYHIQIFYTQLHAVYHVFHMITADLPSATALKAAAEELIQSFSVLGDFFISQGTTVQGLAKAYSSYTDAVSILQQCFFFPARTLTASAAETSGSAGNASVFSYTDEYERFSQALLSKDPEQCTLCLDGFFRYFSGNRSILPAYAKDFYYKLFAALEEACLKLKISRNPLNSFSENGILNFLEHIFSYEELHQTLSQCCEYFFQSLDKEKPEDSTIFMIKDYISKNYGNDALSIKEISDHVFLSASYVCTYFKNLTGQTLNQYLTEFRMEKAMRLLEDPRWQITDISAKVGYSNGNYFSKSFKKYTGLTPSKYREEILK